MEYWKSTLTGEIYEVAPGTINPLYMVGWVQVGKDEYDKYKKAAGF